MNSTENQRSLRTFKLPSLLVLIAWVIIIGGTVIAIYIIEGLFISRHLSDEWNDLTSAQGSVISQLVTLYAAAFVAIVAPAIFGGKFAQLEDQIANTAEEIKDLATESKQSFHTLRTYALAQSGIQETYIEDDMENAAEILKTIRSHTGTLAQQALDDADRWQKTKDKFAGKWTEGIPYIMLLHETNIITDHQRDQFLDIISSRKKAPVDLAYLNIIASKYNGLKHSIESGDD